MIGFGARLILPAIAPVQRNDGLQAQARSGWRGFCDVPLNRIEEAAREAKITFAGARQKSGRSAGGERSQIMA